MIIGFGTLLRVLVFYAIIVGLLFLGFMMLARAQEVAGTRKGIWRYLVIALGVTYVAACVVFST